MEEVRSKRLRHTIYMKFKNAQNWYRRKEVRIPIASVGEELELSARWQGASSVSWCRWPYTRVHTQKIKPSCCCSFPKSCSNFCDPMSCSTPGFPILSHLRICSNSCPLSRWCHPTISSSVTPFSSCLQSFPASGSFPMSRFFESRGQSIGISASASVQFSSVAQSCSTLCNPRDYNFQ